MIDKLAYVPVALEQRATLNTAHHRVMQRPERVQAWASRRSGRIAKFHL